MCQPWRVRDTLESSKSAPVNIPRKLVKNDYFGQSPSNGPAPLEQLSAFGDLKYRPVAGGHDSIEGRVLREPLRTRLIRKPEGQDVQRCRRQMIENVIVHGLNPRAVTSATSGINGPFRP